MPMELIFEVHLEGELDRPRLDRLRKLLNLTPRGRLDDLEDAEFGQRRLRDEPAGPVRLTLWRRDNSARWAFRLTFGGAPPAAELVASARAQVVAAAAAVGLVVSATGPAWDAGARRRAGYPQPMVDHGAERREALERWEMIRR